MKPSTKRVINACGSVLTLAALLFVCIRFSTYGNQFDISRIGKRDWAIGTISILLYAASNLLLTGSWRCILRHLGSHTTFYWALKVFGLSQIGKYIPGSIFQFVGRQALGMADGVPARSLIKSSILEVVLLCFSGSLFGVLVLFLISEFFSTPMSLMVFSCFLAFVIVICRKSIGNDIALSIIFYVLFLAISGLLFTILAIVFSGPGNHPDIQYSLIIGSFILAWLVGLLMPGAPAGMGVRETILLILLGGQFVKADLLMAVLAGRVVTISGDVLFFLIVIAYSAYKSVKRRLAGGDS